MEQQQKNRQNLLKDQIVVEDDIFMMKASSDQLNANLIIDAQKPFKNIIPFHPTYDLEICPREKLPEIARAADGFSIITPATATAISASIWDVPISKEEHFGMLF